MLPASHMQTQTLTELCITHIQVCPPVIESSGSCCKPDMALERRSSTSCCRRNLHPHADVSTHMKEISKVSAVCRVLSILPPPASKLWCQGISRNITASDEAQSLTSISQPQYLLHPLPAPLWTSGFPVLGPLSLLLLLQLDAQFAAMPAASDVEA